MGGGMAALWKKLRFRRGKNDKLERKKGENYKKNGAKGLKIASFWVLNFRTPGNKMTLRGGGQNA